MAQLRRDHQQFVDRETTIVVVGPENQDAFCRYWEEHNLPFLGLPDPNTTVLRKYGQEVNLFKLGRMPAQVIIDRQGIARYVHYGKQMYDIPENKELFDILEQLNREQPLVEDARSPGNN